MKNTLCIIVITSITLGQTSLKAINSLTREGEQTRLYYSTRGSIKTEENKVRRELIPPFMALTYDSFTLDGIVDDKYSESFACSIGRCVVRIVQIKNGLKYFILSGPGILINSGYIHKNVGENPDIIWTVPESSNIENGSVLSLHAFKSSRNKDGSQPIDFYILYSRVPVYDKTPAAKAALGIVRD